jgi:hypothetical protein
MVEDLKEILVETAQALIIKERFLLIKRIRDYQEVS